MSKAIPKSSHPSNSSHYDRIRFKTYISAVICAWLKKKHLNAYIYRIMLKHARNSNDYETSNWRDRR